MTDKTTEALVAAFGGQKNMSASRIAAACGAMALDLARRAGSIATAEAADGAVDRIRSHKQTIKALKASCAEVVDPLKALVAYFDGLWKPTVKMYEETIRIEKERVATFNTLAVPSAELALTGNVSTEQVADVAAVMAPRKGGSYGTTTYSVKIVNPELVPREHCDPSQKRLNALARTHKEKFDVPGCELVVKHSVTVR